MKERRKLSAEPGGRWMPFEGGQGRRWRRKNQRWEEKQARMNLSNTS